MGKILGALASGKEPEELFLDFESKFLIFNFFLFLLFF